LSSALLLDDDDDDDDDYDALSKFVLYDLVYSTLIVLVIIYCHLKILPQSQSHCRYHNKGQCLLKLFALYFVK
jgi:hypothetical protein